MCKLFAKMLTLCKVLTVFCFLHTQIAILEIEPEKLFSDASLFSDIHACKKDFETSLQARLSE